MQSVSQLRHPLYIGERVSAGHKTWTVRPMAFDPIAPLNFTDENAESERLVVHKSDEATPRRLKT